TTLFRSRGEQRAATAGVVVGARLLHVCRKDDALVRMDAAGYLDGERSIYAAMKRAVDLDVHVDGTLRELVSQACRGTRRGLEAKRSQGVVGRNRSPLQNV